MTAGQTLLSCKGVDVSYGPVQILFGVDFEVVEGEIVALLGTNGAGKSTLLSAVCGLVKPSAGTVMYSGHDITGAPPTDTVARGISMIGGNYAREKSVRPAERKITVAANRAAVLVHELAIREDDARRRLTVQIVARAPDDELRRSAERRVLTVVDLAWSLIVRHEQPDRRLADFP